MSGLHLSHKTAWSEVADLFKQYKDPGIDFPTGDCGRIHLDSQKIKFQVQNRKYLEDQVCKAEDCATTSTKRFRKSDKHVLTLTRRRGQLRKSIEKSDVKLCEQLANAIIEFAETERRKFRRKIDSREDRRAFREEVIEKLKSRNQWLDLKDQDPYFHRCNCQLFTMLLEANDVETLLSFSDDEIRSVLGCLHGGQAVGNNIRFLTWHVWRVYIFTNLIIAFGLQDEPEKWGPMAPSPNWYCLRQHQLQFDCDGQTFLYWSRKFVTDDVYMKDFEAMRQLCKDCFRFLYLLEVVRIEVEGVEGRKEDLKEEIFWQL